MRINLSIFHACKGRDPTATKAEVAAPVSFASFNLCEEYANAFRTESYNEFWARVLDLTFVKRTTTSTSTTTSRLPSYGLFVESLLDPDQATVAKVLASYARIETDAENQLLLADYFAETANASLLCGLLLKDIEHVRHQCRPLKATLDAMAFDGLVPDNVRLRAVVGQMAELSDMAFSRQELQAMQSGSATLLARLKSSRKKARARLRFASRLRRAVAVFLVALTASTSVVGVYVALHALVALVALPAIFPAAFRVLSVRWLGRALARLDAAAKGAYILSRDLDTISRLVDRVQDEGEHLLGMLRLCERRGGAGGGERLRPTREVVRHLRKNESSFEQQLDELEEHLFLCFMTINKARSLVVREVLM